MGYKEDLMGVGLSSEKADILGTDSLLDSPNRTSAVALTATGTTLANALALTVYNNVVTTTAASTGVRLPDTTPIGQMVLIQNDGVNILNVWPPTAARTLNAGTPGAALTVAAAAGVLCFRVSTTDWKVYVLAKEN